MSLADDFLCAIAGTSFEYNGIMLPNGFLWEDGKAYSRTTYARLFAALTLSCTGNVASGSPTISGVSVDLTALNSSPVGWPLSGPGIPAGATILSVTSNSITMSANAGSTNSGAAIVVAPWGVGDGTTTFNVPDGRGRVPVNRDTMGGTAASRVTTGGSGVNAAVLGATGGAETHTLTTAQMPAHNHGVTDPGHSHTLQVRLGTTTSGNTYPMQGAADNSTFTGGTAQSQTTGITTQNNGSGSAHNNVQPCIVKNKIIKY